MPQRQLPDPRPAILSWRWDLNPQPTVYKTVALPIAPLQHTGNLPTPNMNARLGSVNQPRHNTHNCTNNETNTPSPVQTALSTTPITCTIGSVVACHHKHSSPHRSRSAKATISSWILSLGSARHSAASLAPTPQALPPAAPILWPPSMPSKPPRHRRH